MEFNEAIKTRRTRYSIDSSATVSDSKIEKLVRDAVKYAPSAFHSQSSRAILLLGVNHSKLWSIVKEILRTKVSAENFPATEAKIDSFAAGHASVPHTGINPFDFFAKFLPAIRKYEPKADELFGFSTLTPTKIVSSESGTNLVPSSVTMRPQHFSCRDISLASRLWKDFSKAQPNDLKNPELWASGVVETYLRLNGVYSYSPQSIKEMSWNVPRQDLNLATEQIKQKLGIETYDPRYCNEEGFLMGYSRQV